MSEDESKYEYWLPNAGNIKICYEAQVNSVVIIGPNGSGKSKLGAWIEQQDFEKVHRITAQRDINFSERIPLKSYAEAEDKVIYTEALDIKKIKTNDGDGAKAIQQSSLTILTMF